MSFLFEYFSAAGCVQYYKIQLVATEDILVVLGNNDLSRWATNGAVARSASKVMVHPEFKNNPNSANADIALITLSKYLLSVKSLLSSDTRAVLIFSTCSYLSRLQLFHNVLAMY